MTTIEKVCAAIERETGQSVTVDTPLSELDIDSLEFMNLLLQIEESTHVLVPYEMVAEMSTVGELAQAVVQGCN